MLYQFFVKKEFDYKEKGNGEEMGNNMKHILHLSDFHFYDDELSGKEKLNDLIVFLKSKSITIDYIVHTGDFIDGKTIASECGKKLV